jgi:hypothetical protein
MTIDGLGELVPDWHEPDDPSALIKHWANGDHQLLEEELEAHIPAYAKRAVERLLDLSAPLLQE